MVAMTSAEGVLLRVVEEVLAPLVKQDGGELYVVSLEGSSVSLHLAGRFAGCPGNALARRHVLEPPLQAAVPGARITITSGALVPTGARRL